MPTSQNIIWTRYRAIVVRQYNALRLGGWDDETARALITSGYGTAGRELLEDVLAPPRVYVDPLPLLYGCLTYIPQCPTDPGITPLHRASGVSYNSETRSDLWWQCAPCHIEWQG